MECRTLTTCGHFSAESVDCRPIEAVWRGTAAPLCATLCGGPLASAVGGTGPLLRRCCLRNEQSGVQLPGRSLGLRSLPQGGAGNVRADRNRGDDPHENEKF